MSWYSQAKLIDNALGDDFVNRVQCMYCKRWATHSSQEENVDPDNYIWKIFESLTPEEKQDANHAMSFFEDGTYDHKYGISHGICKYCDDVLKSYNYKITDLAPEDIKNKSLALSSNKKEIKIASLYYPYFIATFKKEAYLEPIESQHNELKEIQSSKIEDLLTQLGLRDINPKYDKVDFYIVRSPNSPRKKITYHELLSRMQQQNVYNKESQKINKIIKEAGIKENMINGILITMVTAFLGSGAWNTYKNLQLSEEKLKKTMAEVEYNDYVRALQNPEIVDYAKEMARKLKEEELKAKEYIESKEKENQIQTRQHKPWEDPQPVNQKQKMKPMTPKNQEQIQADDITIKDYLKQFEGYHTSVYYDQGIPHIGIGFKLKRPDIKPILKSIGTTYEYVMKGGKLSNDQINSLYNFAMREVYSKMSDIFGKEFMSNYNNLPISIKKAIISGMYRGDFEKGQMVVEYMKNGDWLSASKEFLNHKEYQKYKNTNTYQGIVERLEEISKTFKDYAMVEKDQIPQA